MRYTCKVWQAKMLLIVSAALSCGCSDKDVTGPKKVPRFASPRITYDESGGGPYTRHIAVYDPATGKVDSLPVVGSNGPYGAAISPDGTRIAFSQVQSDVWRGLQIATMAVDGTDLRACTADSGFHDGNPHWSPDGKYLAFSRNNFIVGKHDVFVVKADGTGLRNLTEQGLSWVLDWSPDGSRILIQQNQAGVLRAGTIPTVGGAFQPIIDEQVGDADYSPDGTRIAAVHVFPANRLYVMNADGTNIQTLVDTTQVGYTFRCSWHPDGQSIVFAATGSIQSTRRQLMIYRFDQANVDTLFPNDAIERENPNYGPKP